MSFRFRFTAGFAVISIAIFAIAAIVVPRLVQSNEEAILVKDISQQTTENADVVAGVVTAYTEGDSGNSLIGAPNDSAASNGFESLVMSTLLQSSNIVRLSLYESDGSLLWTSAEDGAAGIKPDSSSLSGALNGDVVTGLSKNVNYIALDGQAASGDLTSTYIPLSNQSAQTSTQVLEVARDVSGALDFRVDNARSSMIRTLFSTLGASLAVLFGIVVVADTMLNRSKRQALAQEVVAAESKMAAEKLELKNGQLQQINEEHDKFLSMVSHELRTPLTSMLAFTEVLKRRQEGNNRETNLDHLDLMRRNGDHLNSLIAELLEVTHIHAEEFEIKKERFELSRLIQDVKDFAEALVQPKNQRLRFNISDEEIELLADRKRMMQLVMNLLSNASAYSEKDTTITFEVEHQADLLKLTITDQGEGISEEDQQRLFDQFYRGNSEFTRAQSGLGLGLPIVKAIVDAHDGKISVRSLSGSGTSVTVLIPTAKSDQIKLSSEAV